MMRIRVLDAFALSGLVCPMVGQFVARVVVVAAHPNELGLGPPVQWTDFLANIQVFDRPALLFPAVCLPRKRPFGDDIDPELTVSIDLARLAVCVLESCNYGKTFHADIGSHCPCATSRLAAQHHRLISLYDGETARPWVGAGGSVGVVRKH